MVYTRANSVRERTRKVTWNILVLCLCYFVCTVPHLIHGYFIETFDHIGDNWYELLLGIYWLQYGFNIALYVLQRDQYWNAYKLYFRNCILPIFYKTESEIKPSSTTMSSRQYVRTPSATSRNYFFYNF